MSKVDMLYKAADLAEAAFLAFVTMMGIGGVSWVLRFDGIAQGVAICLQVVGLVAGVGLLVDSRRWSRRAKAMT